MTYAYVNCPYEVRVQCIVPLIISIHAPFPVATYSQLPSKGRQCCCSLTLTDTSAREQGELVSEYWRSRISRAFESILPGWLLLFTAWSIQDILQYSLQKRPRSARMTHLFAVLGQRKPQNSTETFHLPQPLAPVATHAFVHRPRETCCARTIVA